MGKSLICRLLSSKCLLTTQLLIISLRLKVFTLGKEAKKRRYYEQEYIQDSFLHSEESSKQRRQVGNHAPFDRWKIQCKDAFLKTKEHLTLEFPTKATL